MILKKLRLKYLKRALKGKMVPLVKTGKTFFINKTKQPSLTWSSLGNE
jgi:hypothetical protein